MQWVDEAMVMTKKIENLGKVLTEELLKKPTGKPIEKKSADRTIADFLWEMGW